MSYPPPPGLNSSQSNPPSLAKLPSSLPPRPPPPAGTPTSFKPAFQAPPSYSSNPTAYNGGNNQPSHSTIYGASFTPFQPHTIGPTASAPPTGFSSQSQTYSSGYDQQYSGTPQSYYDQSSQDSYNQSGIPQIRNPFVPIPSAGAGRGRGQDASYDPEMEAQIAQWQSAYVSKDSGDQSAKGGAKGRSGMGTEGTLSASGANAGPLGSRPDVPALSSAAVASAADGDTGVAKVVSGADGKQKTVVRSGGGQSWTDSSLLEWDPAHFRLFVGNLAGEVTDDTLLKAFSRWPSVQKARVIRDKRTEKSKGYGFVSFSDGEEFFQAARDMQGKYIGSHPVLLRRSTTEIRPTIPQDKKGKNGKGGKGGHQGGGKGPNTGAGVHKKGSKTKGGLRVLG